MPGQLELELAELSNYLLHLSVLRTVRAIRLMAPVGNIMEWDMMVFTGWSCLKY